jgi:hypothetical protein
VRSVSSLGVSDWCTPLNVCTIGNTNSSSSSSSSPPPPPPQPHAKQDLERRHDPYNNYPYTFEEFFDYYGRRDEWDNASLATGFETSRKPPTRSAFSSNQRNDAESNKEKENTSPVPPLKMQWACTVCKRNNPLSSSACSICGTTKGYTNSRMDNISENVDSETARSKERDRLRERMQASARGN